MLPEMKLRCASENNSPQGHSIGNLITFLTISVILDLQMFIYAFVPPQKFHQLILVSNYKKKKDFRHFEMDKIYKLTFVSHTPRDTTYGEKQTFAFSVNFDCSNALDTVTASMSILLTRVSLNTN